MVKQLVRETVDTKLESDARGAGGRGPGSTPVAVCDAKMTPDCRDSELFARGSHACEMGTFSNVENRLTCTGKYGPGARA